MKKLFYSIINNELLYKYVNFLLHLATVHRKGDVVSPHYSLSVPHSFSDKNEV